jgi:cell wall-associated NlpC family hydrolase
MRQRGIVYPQAAIQEITTYARSFLGVPYLWGGTSWHGLDCSGFVQLCYRMGGYIIPRDADQQHDALTRSVAREQMQEGDLIFFGSRRISHVAMALNSTEYIHAEGSKHNRIIINSFDSTDSHYDGELSGLVWGLKRVVS